MIEIERGARKSRWIETGCSELTREMSIHVKQFLILKPKFSSRRVTKLRRQKNAFCKNPHTKNVESIKKSPEKKSPTEKIHMLVKKNDIKI